MHDRVTFLLVVVKSSDVGSRQSVEIDIVFRIESKRVSTLFRYARGSVAEQ